MTELEEEDDAGERRPRNAAKDGRHGREGIEGRVTDNGREEMLHADGKGGAETAADNERGSEDAARGPGAEGNDKRPKFGDRNANQMSGGDAVIQHVANGVIAGAENLREEVADDAQEERADGWRPDRRALDGQTIEEIFQP